MNYPSGITSLSTTNTTNLFFTRYLVEKYKFEETNDWLISEKRKYFEKYLEEDIRKVFYRPFDAKYTFYPLDRINQIIVRGDDKKSLMQHFLLGKNIGIVMPKQSIEGFGILTTNTICENKIVSAYNPNFVFPLYLYPDTTDLFADQSRKVNFDEKIVAKIAESVGLEYLAFGKSINDKSLTINEIDILDYIYAVLHSPKYREKYKEFLKIDFPRVPFPSKAKAKVTDTSKGVGNLNTRGSDFVELVRLGGKLRQIHLLESEAVEEYITDYPVGGDNIVGKPKYENGKVWLNVAQYFDHVPEVTWNFYIGGYQPAQKWLKDRIGRKLSYEDIMHYQKIIVALTATTRLMVAIDEILDLE